jgi:hypothetical protein
LSASLFSSLNLDLTIRHEANEETAQNESPKENEWVGFVPKKMKATYATNISSSATGTVVNTYPSNLFGLAVGSSFQLLTANMAIGSLDPSYIVNVLSVTVKYLPAYGRSALTGATSGAGESYAGFQQNFNSSITVATNTVSFCQNSRPIYTG